MDKLKEFQWKIQHSVTRFKNISKNALVFFVGNQVSYKEISFVWKTGLLLLASNVAEEENSKSFVLLYIGLLT